MSATTYLLISGLCFALVHASVKFLPGIPPFEIVFVRSIISCLISYYGMKSLKISPWGKNKVLLISRGFIGTLALLLYFLTLQKMPLASAVTIQYLHPIFTILLASLFLREHATWIQWIFFGFSFLGVFVIQGFDARVDASMAIIGVFGALASAGAYTLIRKLKNEDHALVAVFYLPLVSLFVVGPISYFKWVRPSTKEWFVLGLVGLFTQIAQYFMTKAYQADRAANISNLNYLGIIYALGIGYWVFNETFQPQTLLGMGIIAASAFLSTRFPNSDEEPPPYINESDPCRPTS